MRIKLFITKTFDAQCSETQEKMPDAFSTRPDNSISNIITIIYYFLFLFLFFFYFAPMKNVYLSRLDSFAIGVQRIHKTHETNRRLLLKSHLYKIVAHM
jgi:ascorbate-specific PTS system EIIC-type component UlaA